MAMDIPIELAQEPAQASTNKHQQAQASMSKSIVEDDVSIKRHIRLLKAEYGKVHKNMALGSELMQLTFNKRQSEVKSAVLVYELKTNYPFLQVYEEVSTHTVMYMYIVHVHVIHLLARCLW